MLMLLILIKLTTLSPVRNVLLLNMKVLVYKMWFFEGHFALMLELAPLLLRFADA